MADVRSAACAPADAEGMARLMGEPDVARRPAAAAVPQRRSLAHAAGRVGRAGPHRSAAGGRSRRAH